MWKILNIVEQEISLTYLQTKHFLFRGGRGFFSFTLPKHFCDFSGKICCNETTAPRDLMQRDDDAERSVGGHGSSFDDQNFIADSQHSTVRFQSQSSVITTINSSKISPIYQFTRIFTDLLQRDDDAERSDATRRWCRVICPVAMDPPSMVRVFAVDESV
ncbi:receptor-like protein kinase THESEUS 1 [Senna tora]|uniref:Receptor-like protein kinase THESEUS 1 n=1 Tax=Senna tora TaxID=362788 RepID=A0A835C3V5_9FABA|nr:receptor-like protein kinase THESEUS 1 [Senna tora]